MFKKINCPTCGKTTHYTPENPHRPFCSERCATLDLGAWADEKYKVPTPESESESVNENSDQDPREEMISPPKERQN